MITHFQAVTIGASEFTAIWNNAAPVSAIAESVKFFCGCCEHPFVARYAPVTLGDQGWGIRCWSCYRDAAMDDYNSDIESLRDERDDDWDRYIASTAPLFDHESDAPIRWYCDDCCVVVNELSPSTWCVHR
jgi:hypothetical protein